MKVERFLLSLIVIVACAACAPDDIPTTIHSVHHTATIGSGQVVDLGALGSDLSSSATGIANDGTIVGVSQRTNIQDPRGRAFVIAGGTMSAFLTDSISRLGPTISRSGNRIGVALVSGSGLAPAVADRAGTITMLQTVPGASISVVAVNDLAGATSTLSIRPPGPRAVLWLGSALQYLPYSGVFANGHDVSDDGVVVGTDLGADGFFHAARWTPAGVLEYLPLAAGHSPDGQANHVNAAGMVAGTTTRAGKSRAIVWRDDIAVELATPEGVDGASASDVNEAGVAVGIGITAGKGHAFVWPTPDDVVALPPLPGYDQSNALMINNNGVIVGSSRVCAPTCRERATKWVGFAPGNDVTPPTIALSTDHASYDVDETIRVSCSASDPEPGSGVASVSCPPAELDASDYPEGTLTLTASASDAAGNAAETSLDITIDPTFAGLRALVIRGCDAGVAHAMTAQLDAAESASADGRDAAATAALNAFVHLVGAQSGRCLSSVDAATLLRIAGELRS